MRPFGGSSTPSIKHEGRQMATRSKKGSTSIPATSEEPPREATTTKKKAKPKSGVRAAIASVVTEAATTVVDALEEAARPKAKATATKKKAAVEPKPRAQKGTAAAGRGDVAAPVARKTKAPVAREVDAAVADRVNAAAGSKGVAAPSPRKTKAPDADDVNAAAPAAPDVHAPATTRVDARVASDDEALVASEMDAPPIPQDFEAPVEAGGDVPVATEFATAPSVINAAAPVASAPEPPEAIDLPHDSGNSGFEIGTVHSDNDASVFTPRNEGSLLTDQDLYLFNEGSHHRLWEKLGAHPVERGGVAGTMFGVWAPNAARVSVIGDFNGWNGDAHPLQARGNSGLWEAFVPHVGKGAHYKFHITSRHNNYVVDKTDPFGLTQEPAPQTASIIWDLDYEWNDVEWMAARREKNGFNAPISIYEVHLGSWRRTSDDGVTWRSLTYREAAHQLAEYVKKMNFTHVELLPIMEHPFYGSWGYQCTGFFAPTSRYGTPQDLMYFMDVMHQNGIGVILDWVPSHFPTDEHGLSYFDGTHLFEHADPRKGFHPDWNSLIFNYGRNEVRSFLLSSALYWLGVYHADGLRVDAVASMLYLDYSRKQGEWIPNEHGGRENLEAIQFLRRLNEDVYKVHPDVQVIAEESTAWPMVSRPTYIGGLGFGMKWDMGWMHDTLRYFSDDPIHRKFHHNQLTFRMMYAFTENFVLPLSHDEVVHGKGSLIGKMPGDEWQKFANLRLLFAHMYSQPAKKLIFMGGEFGQGREWNHDSSLEWHLTDTIPHAALQRWVEDLNKFYRTEPALHELDFSPSGFEWIDCCDTEQSIVSLTRKSKSDPDRSVVVVLNFTPVPRHNYQIGVPTGGFWREALNSDATLYGGSGQGNLGGVDAAPIPLHGRKWSVNLTLPPLGAVFLLRDAQNNTVEIDDLGIESALSEVEESELAR
jgi:1,4-alpha-glucan branching enzyme